MIEFMVIAAPRSGTSWVANWLTTSTTHCIHDPLWTNHYKQWDSIFSKKWLGVACTGIALLKPDWVNAHKAVKLILHRPWPELVKANHAIGNVLSPAWETGLDAIGGYHLNWQEVRDNVHEAKIVYELLLAREFDQERWAELVKYNVKPQLAKIAPDKGVTADLLRDVIIRATAS